MKHFNIFNLSVVVIGALLWFLMAGQKKEVISFYGFAETNETEINFNHPVVINEIKVSPGEFVHEGQTLMEISRIKSKESLQSQSYEIQELLAEEKIWKQNKEEELKVLKSDHALRISNLDSKIKAAQEELEYKKNLAKGLKTIEADASSYSPFEKKLDSFHKEKLALQEKFRLEEAALIKEISLGKTPFEAKKQKLRAELKFEDDTKVIHNSIVAPSEGLIGNIHCKEAEHIPSYKTLISFYEPHPSLIKGFVHEDLQLKVNVGDVFLVSSLNVADQVFEGKVTGLGSRVVEIPERLRKLADIKSYGREITISIDPKNTFLQKEKVSLILKSSQTDQGDNILVKNK